MAEETARRTTPAQMRSPQPCPAALVDPSASDTTPFTFSFSAGRHPRFSAFVERVESIFSRTLYRPFMRFSPPGVDRVAVPLAGLPPDLNGFTVAHLSDIHLSQNVPLAVIERIVALTNSVQPDVVVLTGDYVTKDMNLAGECARTLGKLCAGRGVFAVLGNHDYWTDPLLITRLLRQNGVTVLINESRLLAPNLWLAGMDDIWSGRPDLGKALARVPAGAATILLAHEPDFADQAQGWGSLLQLSGHSHGGQVCLPFSKRPILPFLSWKYYAGLHRAGDILVYTSRGVGTIQPPFLFTCRPEVALLTLCSA